MKYNTAHLSVTNAMLDFNPRQKIDEAFNKVGNYRPISRDKLKEENNLLYLRLEREGIIY